MNGILESPMIQFGGLGLSFVLVLAFIRAFFTLLVQRHELQQDLFNHHAAREKAFTEQFLACIDRNSGALEKVEQSLQKIQLQLVRSELAESRFDDID